MHCRMHSKKFETFLRNLGLDPSFFGTPLRSHYPIFSPKIKQEKWHTHCFMKIQNYYCDKLGF